MRPARWVLVEDPAAQHRVEDVQTSVSDCDDRLLAPPSCGALRVAMCTPEQVLHGRVGCVVGT